MQDNQEHDDSLPDRFSGLADIAGRFTDGEAPGLTDAEKRQAPREGRLGGFIGTSAVMQNLYNRIEAAARSDAPVFITGETGTGKELCAEAIHSHSGRAGKPFMALNCAAIPRDLMESELFGHVKGAFTGAISERAGAAQLANGGTLFLDEIAEMTPAMQTKLLRFLQDFTFTKVGGSRMEKTDIRLICATNRDPLSEIQAGNFRADLFYRLHVLPLHMPPLKARGDDVIDLAEIFLRHYAALEGKAFKGFTNDAEGQLCRYDWPGNVRQLQNVIRHIVVMHDDKIVTARMIPAGLLHKPVHPSSADHQDEAAAQASHMTTAFQPLAAIERQAIEHVLQACEGNVPQAAAILAISPSTLYRKRAAWEEKGGCAGK